MDVSQAAGSLTEGSGPLEAACDLEVVVDLVGGLGCPL